jgi:hypothetical protein
MGWARDHEQLVAIDVELWQLVCEERVLDRQRVQVVILLELRNSASPGSYSPIQTNSERSVAQRTG